MERKAQVEHGILFWIGLVIAALLILGTIRWAAQLAGILQPKPDAATMGSFRLLGQQLEILKEGQSQSVPYYLSRKYYLISGSGSCPLTELCLCRDSGCEKVVDGGKLSYDGRQFTATAIIGKSWGDVRNVIITRKNNKFSITCEMDIPGSGCPTGD